MQIVVKMIDRIAITGFLAAGFASVAFAAQPQSPNVLLILADDMGYSDMGCMGSEIKTPNLDQLASSGILFTQAYNTAKCYPTRASLLTGVYFQRTNRDFAETTTLGEMLKPAGYNTLWSGQASRELRSALAWFRSVLRIPRRGN